MRSNSRRSNPRLVIGIITALGLPAVALAQARFSEPGYSRAPQQSQPAYQEETYIDEAPLHAEQLQAQPVYINGQPAKPHTVNPRYRDGQPAPIYESAPAQRSPVILHRRPEIDIDSLDLDVRRPNADEFKLELDYEIELEEVDLRDSFELVLIFTEAGNLLADVDGEPLEIVVPLEGPTDADDDELEFEGELVFYVPVEYVHDPDDIRVEALVVPAGGDQPLARSAEEASYHSPVSRVRVGGGFGIHVDIGRSYHPPHRVVHRRVVERHVVRRWPTHRRVIRVHHGGGSRVVHRVHRSSPRVHHRRTIRVRR